MIPSNTPVYNRKPPIVRDEINFFAGWPAVQCPSGTPTNFETAPFYEHLSSFSRSNAILRAPKWMSPKEAGPQATWRRNLFHRLYHIGMSLLLLCLSLLTARAQEPGQQNYGRVLEVPRQEINDWLKAEIAKSGGDIEKERYHFIIGFSTGHYGQDPVHAIAMRRLAFTLLNNTMAIGDKVSAVAWEMDVWDRSDPVELTGDPATRKQFVDEVPYTTQQGSRGGHDTERALYETLQALTPAEAKSAVLLLLTNSNQSQGPRGERVPLFGANNPKLKEAIQKLGYRTPPARHSFALKGEGRNLNVDVTALFPRRIAALPGSPNTPRYPTFPLDTWVPVEDRPATSAGLNPVTPGGGSGGGSGGGTSATPPTIGGTTPPDTPPAEKRGGIPLWVWILLILLAIGVIAFAAKAMSKPKQPQPVVAQAPAGRPLPGAVEVVVGTKSTVLQPLTTIATWKIARDGDNLVVQSDQKDEAANDQRPAANAPNPTPNTQHPIPTTPAVATLDFDEKRRLRVQAESQTQFLDVKGINVGESNNRVLYVGVGEKLFCRVAAAGAATPTRLELTYHKERKA